MRGDALMSTGRKAPARSCLYPWRKAATAQNGEADNLSPQLEDLGMNISPSTASAPAQAPRAAAPVQARDADGDHDGTPAAAAPATAAPALASSGSVGTQLHVTA